MKPLISLANARIQNRRNARDRAAQSAFRTTAKHSLVYGYDYKKRDSEHRVMAVQQLSRRILTTDLRKRSHQDAAVISGAKI